MDQIYSTRLNCQVVHLLFTNYTCIRCILRVFRVENIESYRKTELFPDFLNKVSQEFKLPKSLADNYDAEHLIFSEDPTTQKDNKCSACFGILQLSDSKEHVADVAQKVLKEDFEFKSFKFSVKVPLAINVRLAQLLHYAYKELQDEKQYTEDELTQAKSFFDMSGVIDIKMSVKWVLAPALAEALGVKALLDDKFSINLQYRCPEQDQEEFGPFESLISQAFSDKQKEKIEKKIKQNIPVQQDKKINFKEISNNNLERILTLPSYVFMSIKMEEGGKYLPPKPFAKQLDFTLDCSHANVYLMGNYLKYSRTLSQSPWEVEGKKLYETSIQEELAKIINPYFRPRDYKFHTGGREDIDVRMLGNGRPFVLEMIDPRRSYSIGESHLKEMEEKVNVNPLVNAINLHMTDDKCFEILKQSETEKIKAYGCVVATNKKLTQQDIETLNAVLDLKIQQKTPLRVLHRRTLMVREKMIHRLKAVYVNEQYMALFVLSSAGTYIKEFVHGDLERTKPNIGSLIGGEADIIQLDVMKLYDKYEESTVNDFLASCNIFEPDA